MSAIFILKKKPPKNTKFSIFLKDSYFVMGDQVDMNISVI